MNKLLHSLVFLAATLSWQPGSAVDLAPPAARSLAPPAVVASDSVAPAPTAQLQLASIGDSLRLPGYARTSSDRAVDHAAPSEALPSTPIALACLVLVICILVSRRNGGELIE